MSRLLDEHKVPGVAAGRGLALERGVPPSVKKTLSDK